MYSISMHEYVHFSNSILYSYNLRATISPWRQKRQSSEQKSKSSLQTQKFHLDNSKGKVMFNFFVGKVMKQLKEFSKNGL